MLWEARRGEKNCPFDPSPNGSKVSVMATLVELLQEREKKAAQGNWVPACGGTEEHLRMGAVPLAQEELIA